MTVEGPNRYYGTIAVGLLLAGSLGTLALMTLSPRQELALIFGGVALLLAFAFGLVGWRERFGKFVVITLGSVIAVGGLGLLVYLGAFGPARQAAMERVARELGAAERADLERVKLESSKRTTTNNNARSFGPVIERVVNDGADSFGTEMYLDLDTSRLMSYPTDQHFRDPHLGQQWLATNGLDLQAINQVRAWTNGIAEAADKIFFDLSDQHLPTGPLKGIFISDSAVVPFDDAQWNSLKPDALATALAPQPSTAIGFYSAAGELPVTLGFKTREGGMGLLQITGFTDNPRGVKVRYKLAKSPGKN